MQTVVWACKPRATIVISTNVARIQDNVADIPGVLWQGSSAQNSFGSAFCHWPISFANLCLATGWEEMFTFTFTFLT